MLETGLSNFEFRVQLRSRASNRYRRRKLRNLLIAFDASEKTQIPQFMPQIALYEHDEL